MATILMPLPKRDLAPAETGVPWRVLTGLGHRIVFATPDGEPGEADRRPVTGEAPWPLAPLRTADRNGRSAYDAISASPEFLLPTRDGSPAERSFASLMLPGK